MLMIDQKVNEIGLQLKKVNDEYIIKRSKESELTKKREDLERQLEDLKITELEKCSAVLQKMSSKQREIARTRLEELGTAALQYSLGADYEMKIYLYEGKGIRKPYAEVKIRNTVSGVETDPMEANGGGVIDIVSIALRIVVMQAYEPFIDGPIIMDEPFKMVSKEYIPMISEFIKNISQDFGRQIIIVTHNEYLASMTDSKIYVTMDDNKISTVEVIK
ncbi:MAG: ATPase [Clostridia bacterium]|nr:ATPase [Clostridia bacterium]